jgi:hypothetical protein
VLDGHGPGGVWAARMTGVGDSTWRIRMSQRGGDHQRGGGPQHEGRGAAAVAVAGPRRSKDIKGGQWHNRRQCVQAWWVGSGNDNFCILHLCIRLHLIYYGKIWTIVLGF